MDNKRRAGIGFILTGILALSACAADAPSSVGASAAAAPPAASLGLPEIDSEFPDACGVVTPDELATIVGNPLGDGFGYGNLVCDWQGGGADETSVGLLLQPVPGQFCPDGLPEGDPTERFGGPASIGYDDIGDVPGAQVGVCVDAGLVLVTVTGAYRAASDEARYTGEAVEVMELILGRL
jgi:hypothetical protein